MNASSPTRERLVTEAMRLFSAKGFEATSVSQIAAAGLAAGSGALYRHFRSKDALLDAGIDRQLDRRRAMRDIRALFAGLGDRHAELTVLGRYLLSVVDEEMQLLQGGCQGWSCSSSAPGRPRSRTQAWWSLPSSVTGSQIPSMSS
jgi:AcrR family transcriptional regulator